MFLHIFASLVSLVSPTQSTLIAAFHIFSQFLYDLSRFGRALALVLDRVLFTLN